MPHQERLNIAVFIDFDNIEIGVKNTLNEHFDVGTILDAIKERGEVVTKIAYADWTRAGEYSRALTQHAIRLVQRNLTPGGDKNGADINLALDALEMAFTHPHINAYVIVGGDSDFLSLVEKLKQYDKKIFVVGGRAFTSVILQRNCHEFIAYENLVRKSSPIVAVAKGGRPMPAAAGPSPIVQAFPIVRRALKILADREVSPQTGLLKSTLLQLDSTFSERNYGASSFLDFAEKLSQAGLVQLKHAGRSVMVELNDSFEENVPVQPQAPPSEAPTEVSPAVEAPPIATASVAEGVRVVGDLLRHATNARWPMYLRNVKQILRAADGGFDEHRYGFNGLMDLLRACQREGLVRLERDRRGGLRVFQGAALSRAAATSAPATAEVGSAEPSEGQFAEPIEASATEAIDVQAPETIEAQVIDPVVEQLSEQTEIYETVASVELEPVPIDTTAELLGRAKARRPRRVAARPPQAPSVGTRRTSARKVAAPRRTGRSKKASSEAVENPKQ